MNNFEGSHMEIVEPMLPTQVDTQIDFTSYESDDEKEKEIKDLTHWIRLVSLSKEILPRDLELTPPDSEGRRGLNRLGRSLQNCNYCYPQKRVSNIHCFLFCQAR